MKSIEPKQPERKSKETEFSKNFEIALQGFYRKFRKKPLMERNGFSFRVQSADKCLPVRSQEFSKIQTGIIFQTESAQGIQVYKNRNVQ